MTPYYDHDGVTIYHGDCREILPTLPGVDLVLTDPPYGVNLGANVENRRGANHTLAKQAYCSYEDTIENLRSIVVPAVASSLQIAERGIVFCAGMNANEFPKPTAIGGIYFPAGSGCNPWGFNTCAIALLYGKASRANMGRRPIMVSCTDSADENGHPCPKPIRPMLHFIELGSGPGDLVLDPFMGSGTTLVAAKRLGRRAIGIEIEEKYCEIAARRVESERLTLFEHVGIEQMELTV